MSAAILLQIRFWPFSQVYTTVIGTTTPSASVALYVFEEERIGQNGGSRGRERASREPRESNLPECTQNHFQHHQSVTNLLEQTKRDGSLLRTTEFVNFKYYQHSHTNFEE